MEEGAKWTIPANLETTSRSLFFFKGSSIEVDGRRNSCKPLNFDRKEAQISK